MQEQTDSESNIPGDNEVFTPKRYKLNFIGSGSEFFGIWWVNLFLTILTLGIYSAWAKVRVRRYFYGHTELAGSTFDFLGNPVKVLIGRIFAVALFAVYAISTNLDFVISMIVGALLFLLIPAIIINAISFRLRNSAYRNLRFGFSKNYSAAYKIWTIPTLYILAIFTVSNYMQNYQDQLMEINLNAERIEVPVDTESDENADNYPNKTKIEYIYTEEQQKKIDEIKAKLDPVESIFIIIFPISLLVLMLLYPILEFYIVGLLYSHSSYGKTNFSFRGDLGDLYQIYLIQVLISIGIFVMMGVLVGITFAVIGVAGSNSEGDINGFGTVGIIMLVLIYIVFLIISAYLAARLKALKYNWMWNNAQISEHTFDAQLKPIELTKVYVTNTIITVFTLGIAIPFAIVNVYRYMVENTYFTAKSNLDEFVAREDEKQSALGDEVGDIFDIEIGL